MELVVRDMKSMGVYDARSISYNGVNYETVQHNLTPMQTSIYNTMSRAWQKTMRNVTLSLETTGGMYNSHARALAIGQYYSSMQRFYNQVLTSMSMPSVIADIKQQLADGKSVVLQIVNTNQAEADRQIANIKANEGSLDDMDLTPRGVLVNYLENYYPVTQYEEYTDDNGNTQSRPVLDSQGKPVLDRDAVRKRDELIAEVNSLSIPDGPLEMLFNAFGTEQVAEITGRTRRVVPRKMPDGSITRVEESRSKTHTAADVQAFQDGAKRILVFSDAGGTGKSYHASRTAKNQQQRVHYVLQPGWVASKAVQGFGRTHRSNQASAPIYKLVTTNIKGQKRFTSTIARRLDQLGALTKGQRDTGSGMFGAMDNLETETARDSLREFYRRLGKNQIDDIDGFALLIKLGLKEKFTDEYGAFKLDENYSRDISTFLNRILALEVDEQNTVFDAFINIYETEMERAMQAGTLDTGMENVKADKIEIIDDKIIKEQKDSGASTHYVQARVYKKPKVARTVDEAQKLRSGFVGIYKTTDGSVRAVFRMADKTTEYGEPQKQFRLIGPNISKTSVWNEKSLSKNAVPLDKTVWRSEWAEEVKKVPEYNEEVKHMLTGTLLPIWDKLPKDGSTKVQRLVADDGSTYLGRIIDPDRIDDVLRQFSMGRTKETYTGQSVMEKAIKQGVKFNLLNYRAQLHRSRVSGEWRLEYFQPYNSQFIKYQYPGIIVENIGYRNRYFIPTGPAGIELLDKILADNPVASSSDSVNDIDPEESYSLSDNSYENDPVKRDMLDMVQAADNDPEEFARILGEWADMYNNAPAPKTQQGTTRYVIPPAKAISAEKQKANREQLNDLIEDYGGITPGENPERDFEAPVRKADGTYVRRTERTAAEAPGTPDSMIPQIEQQILSAAGSYVRMTDAKAMAYADNRFAGPYGYQSVKDEWNSHLANPDMNTFPTKNDIALGEKLYIEAANIGDTAQAVKTLGDLAAMATQAGQVVQAIRMLKMMGPSGQLYYVQKAVDRLNKQFEATLNGQTITIDQDLAEDVILAGDDTEAMDEAMEALITDIANQVPVTLKDKVDAWRYLGMLGNARTHARNFFGNVVFVPVRFVKDMLAAAGESRIDQSQRTKSADVLINRAKYKAVRDFAAAEFDANQREISGNGKYNPMNEILQRRNVFKSEFLNKLAKKNSDLLEWEDEIFLRSSYISAMSQFLIARGIDFTDADEKVMNEARLYAMQEAQKATYRNFSELAATLNKLSQKRGIYKLGLDAILPFKKTPVNILKRGFEYSPVGLAKSMTYGLYQLKSGKITANEFIDNLAAGMTGTMVAALGVGLAALGIARGPGDDDKEGDLEATQGRQDYSIEIGNLSVTIDWLAPVSLPFFVGVQAYTLYNDRDGFDISKVTEAMSLIAEPMLSLSMLDGINSLVESAAYSENNAIISMAGSAATSYASQFIPTILGQLARTIDPYRRANYVDKNKDASARTQRFIQNIQGKIPGLASRKMAYVDLWGRKDTNSSIVFRAFENFVSPGYINRIKETPVDTELMRLARATGNNDVLPSEAAKQFTIDSKPLNLTADQYEQYAISRGQMAYSLIENLMYDPVYAAMSDKQKSKLVEMALKYATSVAKADIIPDYTPDTKWMSRANEAGYAEEAIIYQTLANDTGITGNELVAQMDWIGDEARGNLILASYSDQSSITDPNRKGYKYMLDDTGKARLRELYDYYFWPEYANLMFYDRRYAYGTLEARVELLKKMGENVRKNARTALASELRAAGFISEQGDAEIPLLDEYLNW